MHSIASSSIFIYPFFGAAKSYAAVMYVAVYPTHQYTVSENSRRHQLLENHGKNSAVLFLHTCQKF